MEKPDGSLIGLKSKSSETITPSGKPKRNPRAITYTQYSTMTRCWRMYYYRYVLYLEPATPNPNVALGKAFHKALAGEDVKIRDIDPLREELVKALAIGRKMRKEIPLGRREVLLQTEWTTMLESFLLEGTLDGIDWGDVYEFKYTSKPSWYANAWNVQWQAGFYHWLSGLDRVKFIAVERPSKTTPFETVLDEDYKPRYKIETFNYIDNEDWYRILLKELATLCEEREEKEKRVGKIDYAKDTAVNVFWHLYPRSVGACYSPGECDYIEICKTGKLGENYSTVPLEDREK